MGRKQELDNCITITKKELLVDHYKNAEKNYLYELVQQNIFKLVESDLIKYIKALEWSLNQFHTERMRNINILIKHLWTEIYTGDGIDYIQIRTSSDDKPLQFNSCKN